MKKFSVIVIDPPYGFQDRLQQSDVKRGAADHYKTMTISEIELLPVKDIADPDGAILCLWVPSSLLPEGVQIMKTWGFDLKQSYIWVKSKKEPFKDIFSQILRQGILKMSLKEIFKKISAGYDFNNFFGFGMGHLFRNCHEICLIGTRGKIIKQLKNKSQRTVCFAPNLKHSAKPENLQNSLDLMYPNANKIEIFARRERKSWLCLGNEVGEKLDIKDALSKLITE